MSLATLRARERVLRAALRVLTAERDDPHAHADAESEYADEQLALAARELARATDALPADEQPVGWTETPQPIPPCTCDPGSRTHAVNCPRRAILGRGALLADDTLPDLT